jgi:hypothetical protein
MPSYKDDNLQFLQKKIGEIKVAMFRAEMNSELQLPNNIISTIKTDDDGNIWFFTSCHGKYAQHLEQNFYAYLDYNQKGGAYRVRISGKASIVPDDTPTHTTSVDKSRLSDTIVLVRMKMMHVEYFENKTLQATSSFKTRIRDFFTEMFTSHNYKQFDFS